MNQQIEAESLHHNSQRYPFPNKSVVGPAAVTDDRGTITLGIPFARYKLRLFHSTLDSLAEPSRFILRALSRDGITVEDLLLVTGLEVAQIERLLIRLQQFQLLKDDETLTDYGRNLGRALDCGLHGAETMVWMDQLRARNTLLLLDDTPLQPSDTLASGIPMLNGIDGRGEVFRQEQRLLSWLQHLHRQLPLHRRLPLQNLIETLWSDGLTELPEGPQAASQAWQLQFSPDQTPASGLCLPVSMPMPGGGEYDWLQQSPANETQRIVLPALDWRLRYQLPAGLDEKSSIPPEQRILHCLVTDCPLNVADVETVSVDASADWPLLPVLDRLQSKIQPEPHYLERIVSVKRRGRAFGVDYRSVLTAAFHEHAEYVYQPVV